MRIGLYSDAHYSSRTLTCGVRRCSLSLLKLREAYAFFAREKCELCVSLGDMIDQDASPEADLAHLSEIRDVLVSSGIRTVCLPGNHDAFSLGKDVFYAVLGPKPQNVTLGGKRLIFLDTCFYRSGEAYAPGGGDWTDCFLPGIDAFWAELAQAEEAIVFLHHVIDPAVPADHRLANAEELFDGIRNSGKIKAVFQGHYHRGAKNVYDGVTYITLPAVCENDHAFFIYDL